VPKTAFKNVTLASWDDIHPYASRSGWLFRGERSTDWTLRTTLERCCDRLAVRPTLRRTIENRIIREFRRAYHQFARHIPDRQAIVEWLSIMQHHGAPTRLLDFTYSVYVAAYFALEEAEDDCVVWAVDGPWVLQRSAALLRSGGKTGTSKMLKPFIDDDEQVIQPLFMKMPYIATVWPINGFRLNERLRVQQGAFLIPGDISRPFMENVSALANGKDANTMVRLLIPDALRKEALRRLWSMNISRAALFPGLDGFARSLGVNHSLFNPAPWADPSVKKRRWTMSAA